MKTEQHLSLRYRYIFKLIGKKYFTGLQHRSQVTPNPATAFFVLMSHRHEHEAGDPEHEVEEEHGVLDAGGDIREPARDPPSASGWSEKRCPN